MIKSLIFGERNRVSLEKRPICDTWSATRVSSFAFHSASCAACSSTWRFLSCSSLNSACEHPVLFRHELVGFFGPLLGFDKLALGLLLLGDVRHHRDRAAGRRPAAANAVPAAVRGVVLEALAGGIAQTLDAPGDMRVGVAFAVIAVLGQEAQEVGIEAAGLQQLLRRPVHLLEAIVAEDDVQISSV